MILSIPEMRVMSPRSQSKPMERAKRAERASILKLFRLLYLLVRLVTKSISPSPDQQTGLKAGKKKG